jgi:hypothetical protein
MDLMTENPADEMRTAATLLRTLTQGAVHDGRKHWTTGHTLGSKTPVVVDNHQKPTVLIESYATHYEAVNQYVAAMGPAVGEVLAQLLDAAAHRYDASVRAADEVFHDDPTGRDEFLTTGPGAPEPHALTIARLINHPKDPTA